MNIKVWPLHHRLEKAVTAPHLSYPLPSPHTCETVPLLRVWNGTADHVRGTLKGKTV